MVGTGVYFGIEKVGYVLTGIAILLILILSYKIDYNYKSNPTMEDARKHTIGSASLFIT